MSEVALINTYDNCVFLKELCHQATDPDPLLIEGTLSVLGVGFVKLLVLKMELVPHYLPNGSH